MREQTVPFMVEMLPVSPGGHVGEALEVIVAVAEPATPDVVFCVMLKLVDSDIVVEEFDAVEKVRPIPDATRSPTATDEAAMASEDM
jgi:hypothetical protein